MSNGDDKKKLVNRRLANKALEAFERSDQLAAHVERVLEPLVNMEQMTRVEMALRASQAQRDAEEIRRLVQQFLSKG